jgi:ADP-ribosyl-[dinitrogen reductase] hydrolase
MGPHALADPAVGDDAVLGFLLGGAIGDAFGGVSERGVASLSDDTQLTLATCEAICETGRADPAAIAASFLRWFNSRRLSGLGSATLKALRDLQGGAHWGIAGASGEMAAGNGGAMRIAPLALLPTADRVVIRDVVRVTHRHDEAYMGALAVVIAMRGNWAPSPDAALRTVAADIPDCRVRDQLVRVADLGPASLDDVARCSGTSGWVVETVPLALAAAWHMAESSFAATLDELVHIGGDTDTIASIAGQVAGVRLGARRLPPELLSLVPERPLIEDIGRRFSGVVAGCRA